MKWVQARLSPGAVMAKHYELGQPIPWMGNAGGLATVHQARHKMLERDMAIHLLATPTDESVRAGLMRDFLHVAREVARIEHPNLLRVHEAGVEQRSRPCLYVVTDLQAGHTLRQHIKRHGALERPRAMRLFIACLEGLARVHEHGLLHRSLRPSTLFLSNPGTHDERLLIMHFGLSHLEERLKMGLRNANRAGSTIRHMPPENLDLAHATASEDVFQMALVLIQMLLGDTSISGEDALDRVREHLMGTDVSLSKVLYLGELGGILEKALSPNPGERYPNAASLAEALRSFEGLESPVTRQGETRELGPGMVLADVYEVTREIGRGGFAVVYEGVQRGINRPVAIKVLTVDRPRDGQHTDYEARFLREARAAARIDHPNVVTIHHFGLIEATRQPYMVMERLVGHDLEEELDHRGALNPPRAVELLLGVLDGLAEAHRQGIVHKDLKPSNLFIVQSRRGREVMKITDFGIARILTESEERLTMEGRPVCTPSYAAPEYVQDLMAVPATDVYQIGLVLVEMLTGYPVVDAETVMACIRMHVSGKLNLPPKLMAGPLGPIISKAVAVNHKDRYADADAFFQALSQIDPNQIEVDNPRRV